MVAAGKVRVRDSLVSRCNQLPASPMSMMLSIIPACQVGGLSGCLFPFKLKSNTSPLTGSRLPSFRSYVRVQSRHCLRRDLPGATGSGLERTGADFLRCGCHGSMFAAMRFAASCFACFVGNDRDRSGVFQNSAVGGAAGSISGSGSVCGRLV